MACSRQEKCRSKVLTFLRTHLDWTCSKLSYNASCSISTPGKPGSRSIDPTEVLSIYLSIYHLYTHTHTHTHTHIYIYTHTHIHLHTCIYSVPLGTFGAVLSVVQTDAVLTTNVGRILRTGWRAGERAVGGPDPQESKEFGSFGVFLLDQIIRQ